MKVIQGLARSRNSAEAGVRLRFLRRRKRKMPRAKRARKISPPKTPPTMAPVLEELCDAAA